MFVCTSTNFIILWALLFEASSSNNEMLLSFGAEEHLCRNSFLNIRASKDGKHRLVLRAEPGKTVLIGVNCLDLLREKGSVGHIQLFDSESPLGFCNGVIGAFTNKMQGFDGTSYIHSSSNSVLLLLQFDPRVAPDFVLRVYCGSVYFNGAFSRSKSTHLYYTLRTVPATFSQAELNCNEIGGHLISIHSRKEQKFIQDISEGLIGKVPLFLGAQTLLSNDSWSPFSWTDGSKWDFSDIEATLWHCVVLNIYFPLMMGWGNCFLLICLAACVQSNPCYIEYPIFLRCLEMQTNASDLALEKEYYQDIGNEIIRCFHEINSTEPENYCLYPPNYLNKFAFNAYAECERCDKFARYIHRHFAFGSFRHRSCAVNAILEGFKNQIAPCVEKTTGDAFLEIAKFDTILTQGLYIIRSLNLVLGYETILDVCWAENEKVWENSQKCLEFGSLLREKHCKVASECVERSASLCYPSVFRRIFGDHCQCANDNRVLLNLKLKAIVNVLEQLETPTQNTCKKAVRNLIGSNWRKQLKYMFSCLKKPPPFSIEKIIEIGCKDFVKNNDSEFLVTIFYFIANFLSAVLDRAFRFCPCSAG